MKLVYIAAPDEAFYGTLLPAFLSCDVDILSLLDLSEEVSE